MLGRVLEWIPHIGRHLVAAKDSDQPRVGTITVAHLHVVVYAIVVVFHFERLELERHLILLFDRDAPDALLVRQIVERIVGRLKTTAAANIQLATADG